MYKVIFPEANNEYIKEAAARLGNICEPVLVESSVQDAAVKVIDGEADAMVAGIDYSSRDVILATRDVIGVAEGKKTFSSLFVAKFPDGRRIILSDVLRSLASQLLAAAAKILPWIKPQKLLL